MRAGEWGVRARGVVGGRRDGWIKGLKKEGRRRRMDKKPEVMEEYSRRRRRKRC